MNMIPVSLKKTIRDFDDNRFASDRYRLLKSQYLNDYQGDILQTWFEIFKNRSHERNVPVSYERKKNDLIQKQLDNRQTDIPIYIYI